MDIRRYTVNDKEGVITLFRKNTPEYFSIGEEQDLVYYLENHTENYYVIEFENKLLGCGGINFEDDITIAKISWDILHPDHHGKGLGSMLLKFRMEKIMENKNINIITVRTSQLVFKFYEKFGFKIKEIIKDYWAEGFDLYKMEYPVKERYL